MYAAPEQKVPSNSGNFPVTFTEGRSRRVGKGRDRRSEKGYSSPSKKKVQFVWMGYDKGARKEQPGSRSERGKVTLIKASKHGREEKW